MRFGSHVCDWAIRGRIGESNGLRQEVPSELYNKCESERADDRHGKEVTRPVRVSLNHKVSSAGLSVGKADE